MIATLLYERADINVLDKFGATPLHLAANNTYNPEIIITLLKAGADGKIKDNAGNTPFDYAKENNSYLKGTDAYWLLNDSQY